MDKFWFTTNLIWTVNKNKEREKHIRNEQATLEHQQWLTRILTMDPYESRQIRMVNKKLREYSNWGGGACGGIKKRCPSINLVFGVPSLNMADPVSCVLYLCCVASCSCSTTSRHLLNDFCSPVSFDFFALTAEKRRPHLDLVPPLFWLLSGVYFKPREGRKRACVLA